MKNFVCIVTGPPGAGKSTIAEGLAHHFHKSAYINVDYIRDMIKLGYASPFPLTEEARKQIELSMQNACLLGKNFLKQGFNVFIDDVLERKNQIRYYKNNFNRNKLLIFLLFPKKKVLKRRDKAREQKAMGDRTIELHNIFEKMAGNKNLYLVDNSNENSDETVQRIKKILDKKI